MTDRADVAARLAAFFEEQDRGATARVARGGPVHDIRSALCEIRRALPPLDEPFDRVDWVSRAIEVLGEERRVFRRENDDEAGWGSATFGELIDVLASLGA